MYVSVLAHFRFIFVLPFCFLSQKLHKLCVCVCCFLEGVCEMLFEESRILNANMDEGRVVAM